MNSSKPGVKFVKLREKVNEEARKLITDLKLDSPPIPLRPILESRRAEVVFRPLLIAGATATKNNGFRIYCNCETVDVKNWVARFENPKDEGRTLPSRARFTIAHEIAHTFFMEFTKKGHLRSLFKPKNDFEKRELEKLCDDGASQILIPKSLLKNRLEEGDPLDPEFLWKLSKEFRVSPDVLVIRLKKEKFWKSTPGKGLFVIRFENKDPIIEIAVKDQVLNGIFPRARRGISLRKIGLEAPSLCIFGGESERVICFDEDKNYQKKCEVRQFPRKGEISILTFSIKW